MVELTGESNMLKRCNVVRTPRTDSTNGLGNIHKRNSHMCGTSMLPMGSPHPMMGSEKDNSDLPRRRNAHSIIRSIGRLFRGNKAAAQDQPVTDWTSETIEVPGGEQQDRPIRPDVVVSPPVPPPRVRIHHHVVYEAVPRTPPPCLAYKFGAPDGIDRRDVEEIFEPRDPSFREMASYGDTYVLPAPSVESVEGD